MKSFKKRKSYGWSAYTLIPVLSAISTVALANTSHVQPVITSGDIYKIAITLGAILIAQALIPTIKNFFENRKEQKTFRIYLYAHVLNAIESYDREISVSMAIRHMELDVIPDWVKALEDEGLGVPISLCDAHAAIKKASLQREDTPEEYRYIPYLLYLGTTGTPLEASSPLWKAGDSVSKKASTYLITEEQVVSSLSFQYSDQFIGLVKKGKKQQIERWCIGAQGVIGDMADHYIASIKLMRELKKELGK